MYYRVVSVRIVYHFGSGTGDCPRESREDYCRPDRYTKVKMRWWDDCDPDDWLRDWYMVTTTLQHALPCMVLVVCHGQVFQEAIPY